MWTEDITRWRLSRCWSRSKSGTGTDSPYSEETMKADKSPKCTLLDLITLVTVFMMNVWESTVTLMYGSNSQNCLITFHLRLLSKVRFSVFMVVFHRVSILWIKLDSWIEFKRFLMKGNSFSGKYWLFYRPICDLLWSDPDDRCGWGISPRGAGYSFG